VDQCRHRAELVGGIKRDHALWCGWHHDQQALPGAKAQAGQRIGAAIDLRQQRAIAGAGIEKIPGDRGGRTRGAGRDHLV